MCICIYMYGVFTHTYTHKHTHTTDILVEIVYQLRFSRERGQYEIDRQIGNHHSLKHQLVIRFFSSPHLLLPSSLVTSTTRSIYLNLFGFIYNLSCFLPTGLGLGLAITSNYCTFQSLNLRTFFSRTSKSSAFLNIFPTLPKQIIQSS